MSRRRPGALAALGVLLVSGCAVPPSPSPSPSAAATTTPTAIQTPTVSASAAPPPTAAATPAPSLSLEPPEERDDRVVTVRVTPDVPADGNGTILVTVSSAADTRIDELVLRWPVELNDTLFLAPFEPSEERIREGGDPLVQPWTKWVIGPGERGEPAGTISLGWGPLLAGATLEIPLVVTRRAPGPLAFDLQILAGNALLAFEDGGPAELRVEVP